MCEKHVGSFSRATKKELNFQYFKEFKTFSPFSIGYIMDNEKVPKKHTKFSCKPCDYNTSHSGLWNRHIATHKHKWIILDTKNVPKGTRPPMEGFSCICGKKYKFSSGLSKHRRKCKIDRTTNEISKDETPQYLVENLMQKNDELVELIRDQTKQMREQQQQMNELVPKIGNTTNNQFNLNIFLNEKCKNALNLTDFVESLQLELDDLEKTNKLGMAEGVSKVFIRGLRQLNMYERPIHCSDINRRVLYVKDDDKWDKDNRESGKLHGAIETVAHDKFIKLIKDWETKHPDWTNTPDGPQEYAKMVRTITQDLEEGTENKIIKSIAKEVTIDKI